MNAENRLSWGAFVLFAVVAVTYSSATANTYYVSLTGNDASDGGTALTAFRTISKGVSVLQAGDTLIIKSGNYGPEKVTIPNSGTKDAPITIKAQDPGKVVMTGTRGGRAFSMADKSNIVIEGIKITRYGQGIYIRRSSYTVVRKCIFLNNELAGITLNDGNYKETPTSHHHLFTKNQFLDYAETGPGSPTSGSGISDYGLCMYYSSNVEVTNNYFYGHHHQCCSFKELMTDCRVANNVFDGFYYTAIYLGQNDDINGKSRYIKRSRNLIAEGNTFQPAGKYRAKNAVVVANVTDAIVRNNFVDSTWGEDVDPVVKKPGETNNFPGGGIHIAPISTGAKIYGNIIVNAKKPGILVRTGDCMIHNNTVAGCDIGLAIVPGSHPVVRNNIFYKNKKQIDVPPRMDSWGKTEHTTRLLPDDSVWIWKPNTKTTVYQNNDFFPAVEAEGKNISVDPKFVGPIKKLKIGEMNPRFIPNIMRATAYKLRKDSPCIDAGVDVGLPFAGKAPDIGALEFGKKDPAKAPDAFMAKCVKCGQEWEILPEEVLELFGKNGASTGSDCPKCKAKGSLFLMNHCPHCGRYYLSSQITDPKAFVEADYKEVCPYCGTDPFEWYKKNRRRR